METTKKILMILLALTLVVLFMNTCTDVNQKSADYKGAPEQIITVEQAKIVYDGYTKNRVPIIEAYEDKEVNRYDAKRRLPKRNDKGIDSLLPQIDADKPHFAPSRYGYYDYKTIKQYIAYIEHEAALAEVEISTLRFYFANYPDSEKFPDGRAIKYPKKNTFFIVPTLKKGGKDFGFFTVESEDNKRKAVLIVDKINGSSIGSTLPQMEYGTAGFNLNSLFSSNALPFFQNENSLILNEGGLVPPPHNNSDF